jgi:hypothetical protein
LRIHSTLRQPHAFCAFALIPSCRDNVAHSNQFYGLRIHPEFYSKGGQGDCPCCGGYNLQPAVFSGLIGYKNGVNCIVATQVRQLYHSLHAKADVMFTETGMSCDNCSAQGVGICNILAHLLLLT